MIRARSTRVELPVASRASCLKTRCRKLRISFACSSRQATPFRNTRAPSQARSWPVMTTSCTRGEHAELILARSGPTLTQVPVPSLKSSVVRPSNSKPWRGSAAIDEAHRVAGAVEALLVERRAGELRLAPVAGRDAGAAKARLEFFARGNELHFHAVHRQADRARARGAAAGEHRGRRGFGGAVAGDPEDALAAGLDREFLVGLPDRLRQHRRGILQQARGG